MNSKDFSEVVDRRIKYIEDVLKCKGSEYATNKDRLSNFKEVAHLLSCTPERALMGFVAKHIVALVQFVKEREECRELRDFGYWNEKIGDIINYMILLDALVCERITDYQDSYDFIRLGEDSSHGPSNERSTKKDTKWRDKRDGPSAFNPKAVIRRGEEFIVSR